MPKEGFKSFSLNEKIYDYWFKNYLKNKEKLKMKGISSFSSYLIKIINENKQEAETALLFSKISLNKNILVIKDNTSKEEIELQIQQSKNAPCNLRSHRAISDCKSLKLQCAISLQLLHPLLSF